MRPPICALCGRRLGPDEAVLVAFRKTAADHEWERRARSTPGFVGHPPWVEWFCSEHGGFFTKRTHLTLQEALMAYRESHPVTDR